MGRGWSTWEESSTSLFILFSPHEDLELVDPRAFRDRLPRWVGLVQKELRHGSIQTNEKALFIITIETMGFSEELKTRNFRYVRHQRDRERAGERQ